MCGWKGLLTRALGLQSGRSQGAGRGAEGLHCGLAAWEGYCSCAADRAPVHMQGLAGKLQLAWLTGSTVSQAPQGFPFQPARHFGLAPMPYRLQANSGSHVLSLQYAEHSSYSISPHVIIFATILRGALLSPFHRWGNKLTEL